MGQFAPDIQLDAFNGGTNTRDAPLSLAPNDLVASQNIVPIATGGVVGRGGQSELFGTAIDANPIRSLHRFYKQAGTRLSIATSGTKVYTVTGSGATEIDSGYTADKKFSMITWSAKDKTYWTNGFEALKSYDGTTVATVAGSPPVGSMIELHDDRLWMLTDSLLYFSGLNLDNSWPAAQALNIADNNGGVGKFVKSFGRGLLIVGKDTGLYRFDGSPLLGGRLTRYSDIGCIAAWSADVIPSTLPGVNLGVVFVGRDGVYITDGFNTSRISGKIDPLFTGFFRTAVGKYHTKKRQYHLAFSTSGAANDQHWVATYLEAPGGPAISWNPYTNFAAESFAVWDGAGDSGEMYYGRSDTGKIRLIETGAQDVGVDYKCSFQTRWDSMGAPLRAKQPRWMFPIFESVEPVNYQIGYTFGNVITSGPLELIPLTGISWGTGVTWGPGSVVWQAGGVVQSEPTSTLNFNWGRFVSFVFENTGDGPNFKFHGLGIQTKVKDAHLRQIFSIAS